MAVARKVGVTLAGADGGLEAEKWQGPLVEGLGAVLAVQAVAWVGWG